MTIGIRRETAASDKLAALHTRSKDHKASS